MARIRHRMTPAKLVQFSPKGKGFLDRSGQSLAEHLSFLGCTFNRFPAGSYHK